jgi:hypothetical protein
MSDKIQNSETKKGEMSPFEYFTEIVGWLQIVASPLLFGLIIGTCIYLSDPTTLKLVIGIGIALIGLIIGIVFATRVWRKQGTMHFVSRVMATPEPDNLEEDIK